MRGLQIQWVDIQEKQLVITDTCEHGSLCWIPVNILPREKVNTCTKNVNRATYPNNRGVAFVNSGGFNGVPRLGVRIYVP